MKRLTLLALVCLMFTACNDDDALSDGEGKVTLTAACDSNNEALCVASASGKDYYFGLVEETDEITGCDDFLDSNTGEVDATVATYHSSTEETGSSSLCTAAGCAFSTAKTFNSDGKLVSGLKPGTYIAVVWVDVAADGSFDNGDLVSCLEEDDAPVITDEDQTITFELENVNK